ncbi:hypothetical protein BJ875DRAFT_384927 [Amylocarpus encephaloides]|uniref:Glycosyltransferase family 28 N-terminal domain-containing protein n=1 Tax=Amylocarpus encephaloides TaxID=45428 RepID=A0A9P7YCF2_9HELO|nr:hypothetical protein BJ875DRAFT_384927 [Amylocarpus encephaloides]
MTEATLRPNLGRINTTSHNFRADAEVTTDGRAKINLHNFSARASKLIAKRLDERPAWKLPIGEHLTANNKNYETDFQSVLGKYSGIPRINIAIFIVGSRGDVQPFIPIAQLLSQPPYNHRVRICTHPVFKPFVEENELEFFSIGGDPATLMAYMVKNPGLMPGIESFKAGDIGKRRADISEILHGCWRGCIESGDGMGGQAKPGLSAEDTDNLFVAEAIIANPPSYAHIHCAEKLGIPLHMMFTMPWSPTQSFPHPLASIDRHDTDANFANYISYTMMELLAWQGLGDVINRFRIRTLRLDPISPLWGHLLLSRMKVPFTYAWSSTLIHKPQDWQSHINITGFSFLKQASSYQPDDDLIEFLKAGPPPVYIGFGSIVVDDPNHLTNLIFGAVKRAGVRALVSKGWGGLGGEKPPEGIFLLGNVPHDWLFQHVSAVVHHGGAGTTAIGISMGKPTVVVPFFGDQPFWGMMISKAGAGPEPIAFKKMTEESLGNSIMTALTLEIQEGVRKMSEKIVTEQGDVEAAKSFQQAVNWDSMRCLLSPDRVAVWRIKKTNIRLSHLASSVLIDEGLIGVSQLKLQRTDNWHRVRHRDWYIDEGATDPLTGAMAFASGVATKTLSIVFDYKRNISTTIHKQHAATHDKGKDSERSSSEALPVLRKYSVSWDGPVPVNPVQAALSYPPERLELLAQRIASKSVPYQTGQPIRQRSFRAGRLPTRTPQNDAREEEHGLVYETAHDTSNFVTEITRTGLKVPVSFFYNLANGFHNAPSFYFGDETVRRRDNITGLGSGVKVAGKEFAFGLYDGITGVVTQPYNGAVRDGTIGFVTGVGKGAGGLVFKTCAAAFSLPAYTLKGLEKQFQKRHDRPLKAKILAIRLKQSLTEFERASHADKDEVIERWRTLGLDKSGVGLTGMGSRQSMKYGN